MWYLINNIISGDSSPAIKKFSVAIKSYSILIILKNNMYYAMNMECPHAGKSLLNGTCSEADEIVCPFHNFKFNMKNGACTNNNEGYRLKIFPTKVENNQFYIFIEA